jgi:hypothetical protein
LKYRTAAEAALEPGSPAAHDLALVVDVLPDKDNAAKDLGVFNMAGALPFSIAPGIAPAILAVGSAATACCTGWPGSAPSSEPSPSCP